MTVEQMKSAAIRREPLAPPPAAAVARLPQPQAVQRIQQSAPTFNYPAAAAEPELSRVLKPIAELIKRPAPAPAPVKQQPAPPPPAWSKDKGKAKKWSKKRKAPTKTPAQYAAQQEMLRRIEYLDSPARVMEILGNRDGVFKWDRLQEEFRRPIAAWLIGDLDWNVKGGCAFIARAIPDEVKRKARDWYDYNRSSGHNTACEKEMAQTAKGVLEDKIVMFANMDRMDFVLDFEQTCELDAAKRAKDPRVSTDRRPAQRKLVDNFRNDIEKPKVVHLQYYIGNYQNKNNRGLSL